MDLSEGKPESAFQSRHLLSTVEWETCNFEIGHERNYSDRESWTTRPEAYGWLTLYIFCILVIFVALAIVCDDFFVPSLEAISEKLDLSEDVAGATFMAAGSSAPELFASVAGVTVESDVGIGTIVGQRVLQLDWRPLMRDSFCYALSLGVFSWFAWDGKFEFYESVILLVLYILYIVLMKFNSKLMEVLAGGKHKESQVIPAQQTEVLQFAGSDTEIQADQQQPGNVTEAVLEGRQGSPAKKLPPLLNAVAEAERKTTGNVSVLGKEDLWRQINLSLAHSHHQPVPTVKQRLSVSYPGLRDICDDLKVQQRKSSGHIEAIRLKSVAQKQVMREFKRQTMQQQQTVTVVHVDDSGEAHTLPADAGNQTKDSTLYGTEDGKQDQMMKPCPCLPAVSAEFPELPGEGGCLAAMKFILGWFLFVLSFPFVCAFTWTIPDCSEAHNRKYFLASFFMSILWIAILSFGMVTLVGRSGCILSVDKFTMGLVVIAIGTSVPDALSSIIVAREGFGDMAVSNAIGSNVFDINLGLGLPFEMFTAGSLVMVPHVKFGLILLLILVISLGIFAGVRFKLNKQIGTSFLLMYIAFVIYAYVQDMACDYNC
ncbi:Sodium/potassium/calcium exchanger 3 [Acropora cervicornis]|uniref:Sodium/potassium/calcium exchanger 3 n=1 Tax=Acropora cervicornis TaxID=6130 RepID=A0AAD9VGI9_ACRCE|nr:Sodium/potassium/calcium exchanger 3 [Acropora cervicornis]